MHTKTPKFQLAHRGSAECKQLSPGRLTRTMRTLVALAVGAALVALELHECLESLAILLRSISSGIGPPRHYRVRN